MAASGLSGTDLAALPADGFPKPPDPSKEGFAGPWFDKRPAIIDADGVHSVGLAPWMLRYHSVERILDRAELKMRVADALAV